MILTVIRLYDFSCNISVGNDTDGFIRIFGETAFLAI